MHAMHLSSLGYLVISLLDTLLEHFEQALPS